MNVRVETDTKLVPTNDYLAIRRMQPDEQLMDTILTQRAYLGDELLCTLERRIPMYKATWPRVGKKSWNSSEPLFVPVPDKVVEPDLPEQLSLQKLCELLYSIGYDEGSGDMAHSFKYEEDDDSPTRESYISFEGGPSAD